MKGIILAGGTGSRLYPLTLVASKQLQPVYDKPMIYYSLSTLIDCGIDEICIITTPKDQKEFWSLLGNGSQFGIHLSYLTQPKPEGIAQAFIIAEEFIDTSPVALLLGDNFFHGQDFLSAVDYFASGAEIFPIKILDAGRYGVVELDAAGKVLSLEEKPLHPRSDLAVPGFYLFSATVTERAKKLQPSARGELEIVDLLLSYLADQKLQATKLPEGSVWFDSGTARTLSMLSQYVCSQVNTTGLIGSPELAARRGGFITQAQFDELLNAMPDCDYRNLLRRAK